MKNIIVLVCVLFLGTALYSQNNEVAPAPQTNTTDADPLSFHYGKQMAFAKHLKNDVKQPHKGGDRIYFFKDGKYTEIWNGVECSGTWTYNPAKKKITTVCGNTTREWEVKTSDATKLDLFRTGEKLTLTPKG